MPCDGSGRGGRVWSSAILPITSAGSQNHFVLGCAWLAGVSGGLGNRRSLSPSSSVKQPSFPFGFSAVGGIELLSRSDIQYVAATSTATKKDSPP